jgi:DNA-binding transcriptional regulator/RsmH inhibitor MraZ
MRGRPPSWNPFAELHAASWVEAVRIDEKGRTSLPVAARRRISWIKQGESVPLLGDLGPGGYAELSPWATHGAAKLEEVGALAKQASSTVRSQLVLAAMDRFLQLSLEQGCRVHLPANLRAHLDPDAQGLVRVIVRDDRLWLWSECGWQQSRADRLRAIDAVLRPPEAPISPA